VSKSARMAFVELKTALSVPLKAAYLSSVRDGVREHLNHVLLQHNDVLGGIPLAYWNLKLKQDAVPISHTAPGVFRVQVQASLLVFRVRPEDVLVGKVVQIGRDFVSMTVAGDIQAVIQKKHMGPKFSFDSKQDAWIASEKEKIVPEQFVKFQVLE